jgi:beta-aspartyl-peptidase (threonine type)
MSWPCKTIRPTAALAAALLLATISGRYLRADEPATAGGDVPEVRALLAMQEAAWNKKDLDAFLVGYWKSPRAVFLSGADRMEGFDAVRDRYRRTYQADGKEMGKLTFSAIEVERLGPDSAFARGRYRLLKSDGTQPNGQFTLILRKFPEGWRIIHDHTSAAPKPD